MKLCKLKSYWPVYEIIDDNLVPFATGYNPFKIDSNKTIVEYLTVEDAIYYLEYKADTTDPLKNNQIRYLATIFRKQEFYEDVLK